MAGIIKSGKWRATVSDPQDVAFNFEDMSERADRYLQAVREEAATIIQDAQKEAVEIERRAIEQAKQEVEAEVETRLNERLEQTLTSFLPPLTAAVEEITHAKQSWLNHWREETTRLAVAIAERVIRRELSSCPEITAELLREALQLAVGDGQLKVQFHPDDLERFRPWVQKLSQEMSELVVTDVVADSDVSLGGCRVVTQFGEVDQTIEAQLSRIEEELL